MGKVPSSQKKEARKEEIIVQGQRQERILQFAGVLEAVTWHRVYVRWFSPQMSTEAEAKGTM